ncbi:MAG: hypothetical protein ACUVQ2_06290 [Dissulfurimicrobium sp.]
MAAELLKEADAVGVLAACLSLSFGYELDMGSYQKIHLADAEVILKKSCQKKGRFMISKAKAEKRC